MKIDNFYYQLNLPFLIDLDDYSFIVKNYKNKETFSGPLLIEEKYYNESLVKFLKKINLKIIHSCLFYTPPFYKKVIHIDGKEISNFCKLNFIYGPSGIMNWWESKDDNEIESKLTGIKTSYLTISENNANKIYSVNPDKSFIMNVGRFHNVENNEQFDRWCLSHVLYNLKTSRVLDIHTAKEIFINYINN